MENGKKYTMQDLEANYVNSLINKEPWEIGEDLLKKINKGKEKNYKHRYVFEDLMNYLQGTSNDVCALYGLRRTGKSVLMRQAISQLIYNDGVNPEKIAYITFAKNTKYTDQDVVNVIRDMKDTVRYFFIDEISFIKMNLEYNMLNLLSDEFCLQGIRIVIAGTFSFALKLLSDEVLFDRMYKIDTTYFSYKEANEVFGYSLEQFIQYGGIIRESGNEKMTPKDYMKTAVTNNISNSLIRSDKLYEIGYIEPNINKVIDNPNEKAILSRLSTLIRITVDRYLKALIYNDITKTPYRFSDIGNLADLIRQRTTRDNVLDDSLEIVNIDSKKYYGILAEVIGNVKRNEMSEETFKMFIDILKQIGLIEDIYLQHHTESCFVTNYLRYGLCEEILAEIEETVKLETNGRYDTDLASDNLKGTIQEAIIYLDLQHSNKYDFDKYRNEATGMEVDLIIKNQDKGTMEIYEIKHSREPLIGHAKNIVNKEFLLELENQFGLKISSYNIIYNGNNLVKKVNPVDVYKELKEYAKNLQRTNAEQKWEQLEQRAQVQKWETLSVNFINATEWLCNI